MLACIQTLHACSTKSLWFTCITTHSWRSIGLTYTATISRREEYELIQHENFAGGLPRRQNYVCKAREASVGRRLQRSGLIRWDFRPLLLYVRYICQCYTVFSSQKHVDWNMDMHSMMIRFAMQQLWMGQERVLLHEKCTCWQQRSGQAQCYINDGQSWIHECPVVPGQFVALQPMIDEASGSNQDRHSGYYALASSPYAVHRDSADLDASLIEVRSVSLTAFGICISLKQKRVKKLLTSSSIPGIKHWR